MSDYKKVIESVKSPLGALVLFGLIAENIMFLSVGKTPAEYQIFLGLGMIIVFILIIISLVILTTKQVKKDDIIQTGESDVSFDDVSSAINHVGDYIREESKNGNAIIIKNYGLDLALTIPWATTNFLNNKDIENVSFDVLVIDKDATLIKENIGNKGTLQIASSIASLNKLFNFVNKEKTNLTSRNISIHIKAYESLPVIHGFLVNDRCLYLSFTKVQNSILDTGGTPYLFFTRKTDVSKRFFSVYSTWFDYTWSIGRDVFVFKNGEIDFSY